MKGIAAFTLIEILVVIVLVGIMAGIAIHAISSPTDEAEQSANTTNIRILQNQIEAYRAVEGMYPSTLGDLLTADPPYIRELPGGESAWNYTAVTGQISKAD